MLKASLYTLIILLAGGFLLRPLELSVRRNEENLYLLPPSLLTENNAPDKLEQQLFFVSLGGLRAMVAAFLSLNAYTAFERRDWADLENRYKQIVALAPQNNFYWDMGSWHLAYNAATSAQENKSLRPTERNIRERSYINKGKNFLRAGTKNNPDSYLIHLRLAQLLSDPDKYPEYEHAAKAYKEAIDKGAPNADNLRRAQFYALCNLPAYEKNCYTQAKTLYQNPKNRMPTLKALLFTLQNKYEPNPKNRLKITQLFQSPRTATWALESLLTRKETYPTYTVKETVDALKPYAQSRTWSLVPATLLEKINQFSPQ